MDPMEKAEVPQAESEEVFFLLLFFIYNFKISNFR